MVVKRIVANIATDHVEDAKAFYADILGLRLVMDHGWIVTFAGEGAAAPQNGISQNIGAISGEVAQVSAALGTAKQAATMLAS